MQSASAAAARAQERERERVHQKSHGSLRSAAARSIYSRTDAAATAASASPGEIAPAATRVHLQHRRILSAAHLQDKFMQKKQVERWRNLFSSRGLQERSLTEETLENQIENI